MSCYVVYINCNVIILSFVSFHTQKDKKANEILLKPAVGPGPIARRKYR